MLINGASAAGARAWVAAAGADSAGWQEVQAPTQRDGEGASCTLTGAPSITGWQGGRDQLALGPRLQQGALWIAIAYSR